MLNCYQSNDIIYNSRLKVHYVLLLYRITTPILTDLLLSDYMAGLQAISGKLLPLQITQHGSIIPLLQVNKLSQNNDYLSNLPMVTQQVENPL